MWCEWRTTINAKPASGGQDLPSPERVHLALLLLPVVIYLALWALAARDVSWESLLIGALLALTFALAVWQGRADDAPSDSAHGE